MKKLLLLFLLITIVFCAIMPAEGFAQNFDAQNLVTVTTNPNNYILYTEPQGDGSYMVGFNGAFFGNSNIEVYIMLYSSPSMPINFDIKGENLTIEQKALRDKIIGVFEILREYINLVDELSNANYNGEDYYVYGLQKTPNATGTSDAYTQIRYLPGQSDINAYNQATAGQRIQIDKATYQMLECALDMYEKTECAFNPALYRLVDLWGFSSRTYGIDGNLPYDREWVEYKTIINGNTYTDYYYPLPDQKYVDTFKQSDFVDFSTSFTLQEQDGNYYLTKNVQSVFVDGVEYQQWIDLGGIAKGFISDYIAKTLKDNGFDSFSINLGSSSQTRGDVSSDIAKIYLTDPNAKYDGYLFGLPIANQNLSSSGLYERFYQIDGVRYSHIIDGTTGRPAQSGVDGITIISPTLTAAQLDCLTTAYVVLGKDAIVDLTNSNFAEQNDLKITAVYTTINGKNQILSNVDISSVFTDFSDPWYSCNLNNYGWALTKNDQGKFVYDGNVVGITEGNNNGYKAILITLGVMVCVTLVAVVAYFCIKGKYNLSKRISQAKKDKFFKPVDVFVYLCVVLVIVVLFSAFFTDDTTSISTIKVVDMQTGEELFVYNVTLGDYEYLADNSRDWQIDVQKQGNKVVVELTQQIGSAQRYNQLTIDLSNGVSAQMTDSICGTHQDCVRNFAPLTTANKSIVCSPNYLKVISN